jgi:hypothetical protein
VSLKIAHLNRFTTIGFTPKGPVPGVLATDTNIDAAKFQQQIAILNQSDFTGATSGISLMNSALLTTDKQSEFYEQ